MPENIRIIIDNREPRDIMEMINSRGARVISKQLSVADYIVSDRIAIERKSRDDFESSLISGRLFDQVSKLKSLYDRPVVLIEGSSPFERIDDRAILGALASLISDNEVSVIFTKDRERTAEIVFAFARHEQVLRRRYAKEFKAKKRIDGEKIKQAMLESVYGIGPKTAETLLKRFSTIERMAKASKADLQETIGEKKGGLLWKVLHI